MSLHHPYRPRPLVALLATCLAFLLAACLDETLVYTEYLTPPDNGERDIRLKVSVPRTSGNAATIDLAREERIETLDVMVFERLFGSNPADPDNTRMYLRSSSTGTKVLDVNGKVVPNEFEVNMPLGDHMEVHVFANAHDDLIRSNVFNNVGTERETLLLRVHHAMKDGLQKDTPLPMHGIISDVTIDRDHPTGLKADVLRSVAKVSVMLNGSIADNGQLKGNDLQRNEFQLRSLYAYYPADSGRVATADTTQFYTEGDDKGQVMTPTLPQYGPPFTGGNKTDHLYAPGNRSIDRADGASDKAHDQTLPDVKQVESIYLYENKPWSLDGYDQKSTRIVVGGVFTDWRTDIQDMNADGTPRVSYYRINFQTYEENSYNDTDPEKQFPILRNHHYVFNIVSVAAPGYNTPEEAANGKPINIKVKVIDWKDELLNVEYDGQTYFQLSQRTLRLPREAYDPDGVNHFYETFVEVKSDEPSKFWGMYFEDERNGVTDPATRQTVGGKSVPLPTGEDVTELKNARFHVIKSADRITVRALKPYSDWSTSAGTSPNQPNPLPAPDKDPHRDVLVLKVKNLLVKVNLVQEDASPNDWGNGGNHPNELGPLPPHAIDIGLNFYVADGNAKATPKSGTPTGYAYSFSEGQGYYSANDSYFSWNTAVPTGNPTQSGWSDDRDPCQKIDAGDGMVGKWRTPTIAEIKAMIDAGHKWGTYTMPNGSIVNGMYFGTNVQPSKENQDKYAFLPAAGRYDAANFYSGYGSYYARDNKGNMGFNNTPDVWTGTVYGNDRYSVRCVRTK